MLGPSNEALIFRTESFFLQHIDLLVTEVSEYQMSIWVQSVGDFFIKIISFTSGFKRYL